MSFGLNRAEVIGRLGADVTVNHLVSGGRVSAGPHLRRLYRHFDALSGGDAVDRRDDVVDTRLDARP